MARIYERTGVEKICLNCGSSFYCSPARLRLGGGKYCCWSCRNTAKRAIIKCVFCGKKRIVYKSRLNEQRQEKYYSKECRLKGWKGKLPWNKNVRNCLSHSWRGGRQIQPRGYIYLYTGFCSKRAEHRLVVEKIIGRKLKYNSEPIWHLNGLIDDNRPKNLYVFRDASEMMKAVQGSMSMPEKSNIQAIAEQALKGSK